MLHIHLAKVLNRQCVLSCSFEGRSPQCELLVDQFVHLFVCDIQFAHFYAHKPLVSQAHSFKFPVSVRSEVKAISPFIDLGHCQDGHRVARLACEDFVLWHYKSQNCPFILHCNCHKLKTHFSLRWRISIKCCCLLKTQ